MVIYPVQERQALEEQERCLYRNTSFLNSDTWKGCYSNQRYGQEMSGLGWIARCPLPCETEPQHWLLPCIPPRDLISQLLFRGLFSASFICTLLFQGEALASNGSLAGVGGQHRARHMGNSGTELTLPVSGIGRGLQAGTHGIATTWPPPLPCTSLHAEQKLCTQRLQYVKKNVGNKRKWTWQAHPPSSFLDMDASILKPQCQKHQSTLILNRLLLPVL